MDGAKQNHIPEELVQLKGHQHEATPDWKALRPDFLDSSILEHNSLHEIVKGGTRWD